MKEEYRQDGRYVTATDVSERLIPDLYVHEVMLWPPDLFAYTSYILTMTSAYQLVVSPPPGKQWQPDEADIGQWLLTDLRKNLQLWFKDMFKDWDPNSSLDSELIRKLSDEVKTRILSFRDRERPNEVSFWEELVQKTGEEWQKRLGALSNLECDLIDDTINIGKVRSPRNENRLNAAKKEREKKLIQIVLTYCPPVLIATWAYFYRQAMDEKFYNKRKLQITELLCNQDYHRIDSAYTGKLWNVAQSILSLHAISDIASVSFGLAHDPAQIPSRRPALEFAEKLLFGRCKGLYKDSMFFGGGSLSTFNAERVRILPKRHNPNVGITLRSISSNLAFHQSPVDVVWRKAKKNPLAERLSTPADEHPDEGLTMLLVPFPETVRTDEFEVIEKQDRKWQRVSNSISESGHGYFSYKPRTDKSHKKMEMVEETIQAAQSECPKGLDIVVFPETSLTVEEFTGLEKSLIKRYKDSKIKPPNLLIAGVSETIEDIEKEVKERENDINDIYFSRNAVYCKYFDDDAKTYYTDKENSFIENCPTDSLLLEKPETPKFKQYKHHRWQLNKSQISRYGLSGKLDSKRLWWEAIKVPKRRVSFLNVGNRLTVSHLICEDLARQDPIADLIRHVGPSLVVAILMDGPQLKNRWSARYATVLSDDPGSSVITLTSFGMVKRDTSPFGGLSRVIGLWNDSGGNSLREIELATSARGVLLTLELVQKREKTADGREERFKTSIVRLQDVIQIYPYK